eukprot:jgi/Botrbrau1/18709/Bobra.0386s0035.1
MRKDPSSASASQVLSFVAIYFACNWGLNLVNKWVLGSTQMPLLLTITHMVFSTVVLLPFMLQQPYRDQHRETLRKHWGGLLAIGFLMALNISLSNASLVSLSLSLNQVIRASMPVMTVAMAFFIEGQQPTLSVVASLAVLSFGVAVCVWDNQANGTLTAINLCILSTLANAACLSTSGKLLTEKVDVLRLTFYISPICAAFILPFTLYFEVGRLLAAVPLQGQQIAAMFLISSLLAITHNLVNYKLVQHTSAVSATVIGEVKTITLIVLSAFLLGEKSIFTPQLTGGCIIAMLGFCWYSHCKLAAQIAHVKEALSNLATPDEERGDETLEARGGKPTLDASQKQKSFKPGQASEIRVIARSA